jgi:AcrR family transcriptional regulator
MMRQDRDPSAGAGRAPDRTRRRIVDATVELCATIGPSAVTVSAVAERARVQRLTVYRHFDDRAGLLEACRTRIEADPTRPTPTIWTAWSDPVDRLIVALEALFAHYRANARLLANLLRDATTSTANERLALPHRAMVGGAVGVLAPDWASDPGREVVVRAALGLAVAFGTWRTLVMESGLGDSEAIDLLVGAVEAAAEPYA